MRVLQLRKSGTTLDLHPYVTVLQGLDDTMRAHIVNALSAVPAGGDTGLAGLIEAHGVMFDLTPAALALLDLHTSLDVVVRRSDLPGADAIDALSPGSTAEDDAARRADAVRLATELVGVRRTEVEAARKAVVAARAARESGAAPAGASLDEQLEARLAGLREERDNATAARAGAAAAAADAASAAAVAAAGAEAVVVALGRARDNRRAAAEAASLAAAEFEAARAARDPFAASALTAAHEHLAELEAEAAHHESTSGGPGAPDGAAAGAGDEPPTDPERLETEIDTLRGRRTALEAALVAATGDDRHVVEAALADLRARPPTELVPSVEAFALADEIQRIDHQLGGLGAGNGGDDRDIAAARQRLEAARTELFDAEQAVRVPELDRTSIEALEQAHADVLDAQDKVDSRFGGKRAQARVDEARATEQVVLDRLGFNTYADFMMGTSMLNTDPVAEARLDAARDALAVAEDEWASFQADVDAELTRAQLVQRRRSLRERARELLGVDAGAGVVDALRRHRVEAAATDERAQRLQEALIRAGLGIDGERLAPDDLANLADVWLAEDRESAAHRGPLEQELAEVEARLAQLLDRQAELAEAAGAAEADADRTRRRQSRLDEARAAVTAAEARIARNRDAEADMVTRTRAFDLGTAQDHVAAEQLASAQLASIEASEASRVAREAEATAVEVLMAATATVEALEADVAMATTALDAARAAAARGGTESLDLAVAAAEDAYTTAVAALAAAEADPVLAPEPARREPDRVPDEDSGRVSTVNVDEVEWYLLARLAAQRAVSYAGSVPLVLDDALGDLADVDVRRVLHRLERMAASVQVVLVSDDWAVAQWAVDVGPDRAALVSAG